MGYFPRLTDELKFLILSLHPRAQLTFCTPNESGRYVLRGINPTEILYSDKDVEIYDRDGIYVRGPFGKQLTLPI